MNIKKLVLFSSVIFGVCSMSVSSAFSDLPESHWAYDKVNKMQEKGVISGYEDGTFRPQNEVTREEFATILAKTLDLKEYSYRLINYKDVSSDRWSSPYINSVSFYLSGDKVDGEYYFRPTEPAIREDIAVAVVIAKNLIFEEPDYTVLEKFSDKNQISEEKGNGIAIAVKNGIMNGNADGTFNPKGKLTRAEVTALMCNILNGEEKENDKTDTASKVDIITDDNTQIDINKIVSDNDQYSYIFFNNKMFFVDKYEYNLYNCNLDGSNKSKFDIKEKIEDIKLGYNESIYCMSWNGYLLEINLKNMEAQKVLDGEIEFFNSTLKDSEIIYYKEYPKLEVYKLNLDTFKSSIIASNAKYPENGSFYIYKGKIYYIYCSVDNKYNIYCNDELLYNTDKKIRNLILSNNSIYIMFDDKISVYSLSQGKIVDEKELDAKEYEPIGVVDSEINLVYRDGEIYEWNVKNLSMDKLNYNKYNSDIILNRAPERAYICNDKVVSLGRDILIYDLNTKQSQIYKNVVAYDTDDEQSIYAFYENSIKNEVIKISLTGSITESKVIEGGKHQHLLSVYYKDNMDGTHSRGTLCLRCGEINIEKTERHSVINGICTLCDAIVDSNPVTITFDCDKNQQIFSLNGFKINVNISGEGRKEVEYEFSSEEDVTLLVNNDITQEELSKKEVIYDSNKTYEIEIPSGMERNLPNIVTLKILVKNEAGKIFTDEVKITLANDYYCWTEADSDSNQIIAHSECNFAKCTVVEGDSTDENSKIIFSEERQVDTGKSVEPFYINISKKDSEITVLMRVKYTSNNTGRVIKNIYEISNGKISFKEDASEQMRENARTLKNNSPEANFLK